MSSHITTQRGTEAYDAITFPLETQILYPSTTFNVKNKKNRKNRSNSIGNINKHFSPELNPKKGGKIKFPAPKKLANNAKPIINI